ncbi:ABC transporter permease [Sutterella sp.]|uniref:ABC transporter permease n=1 Tax=Sutterella sp. TaxID=1981025 RepID=UPI0026E0A14D|nr:ABC transporter permease [Sutterella sp.]MDO5532646.1 ABC transporter permease [Sutterella sp.]
MLAFLTRRLLEALVVLITVAAIAFVLFQFIGDPVAQMLPMDASPEDRARLTAALGLDQPAWVQFLRFLGNAAQGDFGLSLRQAAPVATLFAERLPATMELAFAALILALVLGIPAGVRAAVKPDAITSKLMMGASVLGMSLPTFLIGILLILVFSVELDWLPSFGRGEVVQIGWWSTGLLTADGIKHLILPAVTLAIFQLALIVRLVRAEMLEVIREDFIKFARARGLSARSVYLGHALKNTLLPVITITGLQLGGLIAFSIVTETVFQWPGMGMLFLQSVQFADIPVLTAYLCLMALFFVVINLLTDALCAMVDPRLKISRRG